MAMDPVALRAELRRRKSGGAAEVVTTKEDVAAAFASKKTKAYGERRYWEARYDDEDVSTDYDWLCDWAALAPIFERKVGGPAARSLLHTGCGNSPLGAEAKRAGFCDRCVNVDYSGAVVDRMAAAYPSCEWDQGDCTDMDYESGDFDVVLDKGTLDAMACHDDERVALRRGRRYVSECFRVLAPGGVLLIASFGQPETRLRYLAGHDTAEDWLSVDRETIRVSRRRNDAVHVYTLRKAPRAVPPCCKVLLLVAALAAAAAWAASIAVAAEAAAKLAAADLEPAPGAAQCNYELLKSFAAFAGTTRWTLGAGTLLGALRTTPPGLLRWEHDVDVYAPARDASDLVFKLATRCPVGRREPDCGALEFRGFVDKTRWTPCCGFGYKVFHGAAKGCENPNFKGSYLGRFPLVSADFSTSDHLSERSRT